MFTIKHYEAGSFNYNVFETDAYSVSYGGDTSSNVRTAAIHYRVPGSADDAPGRALILNQAGEKAYVTNSSGQTVDKVEAHAIAQDFSNRRVQQVGA
jgi:hypothetical protein